MSKMPSPRAAALQAMREEKYEREQARQKAERAAQRGANLQAPRSREPAKPLKPHSK
jgi:hypothetical protein